VDKLVETVPKQTDIKKILLIGSGPIVIGQACEFDYSGTQACKALREEGFYIILLNSNPATIMTDPEIAHRTYIEPITPEIVKKIIEKEKPDAILPTMGGQTALNIALKVAEDGFLEKHGVQLIGASEKAIKKAEDRNLFKEAMWNIGLNVPKSSYVNSLSEAMHVIKKIGFPAVIRPSFTLGGTGGNIAFNQKEYENYVDWALDASPVNQVLIEESVLGWKEYELEVMRDKKDNVVIVCSIENFDPMGVHTGDSITVAPAQTLTDKEYQLMRDASIQIIREIGVETGGSNIQFAVNPENGYLTVIEMNPRVSRSSALASKATGFPIAKIAAKLAVGYTLDEIQNDITRETPASFEPTIDYCVVKFPRFNFEKFPSTDKTLTSQMKSVGEAMSIGRTFKEALQKSIRSLEIDSYGFESHFSKNQIPQNKKLEIIKEKLTVPNWERVWIIADVLRMGMSIEEIFNLTKINEWFLYNLKEIVDFEEEIKRKGKKKLPEKSILARAKELGFSDIRLGKLLELNEKSIRKERQLRGINATFKNVDTCGAEFEAHTPYLYSTYESECEAKPTDKKKVLILGGGPNRIGQGIEFDYCCVHCSFALKEDGYETIMVNCNPETVSTDYDTSDRLYFEPLTFEDVMNIVEVEKPWGAIVQFGGQTPLKLAVSLKNAGVNILGTSPESIDRAENRKLFKDLIHKLNLKQPDNGTATSMEEAEKVAEKIGYPVVVRPSYVLGGRAMEIVYDRESIESYMSYAVQASPDHPVLIDKFLDSAVEVDVDAISDGHQVVVGGIMEHIEEAGIHSGDSACSLSTRTIPENVLDEIRRQTRLLALELNVIGLINIQFAIKKEVVYILEVNPRASRTIPFVSKTIGVPLAKLAAKVMAGKTLSELGFTKEVKIKHIAVKESVFPFIKFPNVDTILGPEMKSTGEVMGIDKTFGLAFAKSQAASGTILPLTGTVFISIKDEDKLSAVEIARQLSQLGFKIMATKGTVSAIRKAGMEVKSVLKVKEGRPHIVDHLTNKEIDLVINTTFGKQAIIDSYSLRRTSLTRGIPYCTTIAGAFAAISAIQTLQQQSLDVYPIQEYF
jgi:carbamoyl-phosphate synthase large subunit